MDFYNKINDIFEAVVDQQGRHVSSVDLDGDNPEVDVGPEVDFPKTAKKPSDEVIEPFKDEQDAYELDKKKLTPEKIEALKNIRSANLNNNLIDLSTAARKHVHQYLVGKNTKGEAEKSVKKVATVANAIDKVVSASGLDKVPTSAAKQVFDDEPDEAYDEILKHEVTGIGREIRKKDLKDLAAKAAKWDKLQAKEEPGLEGFDPTKFDDESQQDTVDLSDVQDKTETVPPPSGDTKQNPTGRKFDGTEFKDEAERQAYLKDMEDFGGEPAPDQKRGMMQKVKDKFRKLLRRESTDKEFEDLIFND